MIHVLRIKKKYIIKISYINRRIGNLDKSFIPDIDFGKNCLHCSAENFGTVY